MGDKFSADFSDKVQKTAVKAKNDKNAFSELIVMYSKRIQAMVVPMASSPDEVSDLSQEGLMGLCRAVKTYDENKGTKFTTYANVCIRNNILSALRKKPESTDEINDVEDESLNNNTESVAVDRVWFDGVKKVMGDVLTKTEIEIFKKYLRGKSYDQIATEMGTGVKNVDNGMQRVRKKLRAMFEKSND